MRLGTPWVELVHLQVLPDGSSVVRLFERIVACAHCPGQLAPCAPGVLRKMAYLRVGLRLRSAHAGLTAYFERESALRCWGSGPSRVLSGVSYFHAGTRARSGYAQNGDRDQDILVVKGSVREPERKAWC